jgi:acyl-CoA thioesterase-2
MPTGLEQILELEQLDDRLFRGLSHDPRTTRVFGGQVAAQALVAAGRTVPGDRAVHSLHSYFLRPGDPSIPLIYEVDPIRDGRSFTTRRVVAIQHGEAVFQLSASFTVPASGFEHQVPESNAPDPDTLPTGDVWVKNADPKTQTWYAEMRQRFPLDIRFVGEAAHQFNNPGATAAPHRQIWVRSSSPLPDDPLIHVCAATYFSDLFLLASALLPHGFVMGDERLLAASLDHAVWFHQPFRADDWLLYVQEGSWAGVGRALCRGLLFGRDGRLVASVMQEGLLRQK